MVADQLTLLRISGDSKGSSRATRHVVTRGPTIAARIAASNVDLSRSTRTTALADIELLTAAGDALEPTQADEICAWALATLRDPQSYSERTRPTFAVSYKIIELLKSMVWAMSEDALHSVIEHFLDQPPITDDGIAQALARLIHAIPVSAWRASDRKIAADRNEHDAAYLREAFLAVAAPAVPESREEIHRRARAGELLALDAIDDVRTLPSDAVDALASRLCGVIDSLIEKASKGEHAGRAYDPSHALTLLSIWHPTNARWDRIKALLAAPHVRAQDFSGALEILAVRGAELPDEVKKQLIVHVTALRHRAPKQHFFLIEKDVRSLAAEAFAALTQEASRSQVIRELLCKDAAHRASSARIIERFGADAEAELLLALAGDASAAVRDAALCGLSKLVVAGRASDGVVKILLEVLNSGGKGSAAAVVSRLVGTSDVAAVSELLAVAVDHPSAQIRQAARDNAEG